MADEKKIQLQLHHIKKHLHLDTEYDSLCRDDLGLDYQAKPTDTFIVSYPQSGRTWAKTILWSLIHDGAQYPEHGKLYMEYPWLEREGKELLESMTSPRIIASHLPMNLVPQHPEAKYIIICRNPKDVVVSHHFLYVCNGWEQDCDFDDHVSRFFEGKLGFGSYFDHLKSYLPFLEHPKCLLVFYEEMVFWPEENFKKLAIFLGKNNVSDDLIKKVVYNTRIEEMSKNQQRWYSRYPAVVRGDVPRVGQGKVGSWRKYLTQKQSEAIDRMFWEKMQGTAAENWWEDVMKW